jgi:molybdate transport system substrate-binding protein
MNYVEQKGLTVPGSRANLLRNELVLVAPADSRLQADIKPGMPLATLLGAGRLAMADPDTVPAGKYGKAALQALGAWNAVSAKVARADNVRSALMFVARGEAPLGIVYRTDAAAERKVRIVGVFPPATHPPIVYPVAMLKGAGADAKTLYDYLKSGEAAGVFRKHGFVPY